LLPLPAAVVEEDVEALVQPLIAVSVTTAAVTVDASRAPRVRNMVTPSQEMMFR
jgi:hypothetical protein